MQWRKQFNRFLRRPNRWIVWALTPIALFAGGFFALPALLPDRLVHAQIDHQIGGWTGGAFRLRSGAEVAVAPGFRVAVANPAFVHATDTTSEPVVAAERLVAQLKVLPLLLGTVEIANLTLLRPELDLGVSMTPHSAGAPLHADSTTPVGELGEKQSPLVEVTVIDGTLRFDNANSDDAISGLNLSLGAEPSSGVVSIQGGLALGTRHLRINGRLDDLRALVSDAGTQGKLSIRSRPRIQATQTNVTSAQTSSGAPEDITDTVWHVADLLDLFRTGFGQVRAEGTFSMTRHVVGISDATLSLGGMDLRGSLRLRSLEEPVFAQLLQVPAILHAIAGSTKELGEGDWRNTPIQLAWPDGLEIDAVLAGENLRHQKVRFETASVSVAVEDAGAKIGLSAAGAALGQVQAEFSMHDATRSAAGAVSLTGSGRVDDVSVRALSRIATAMAPPPMIGTPQLPEGTMNGVFDLTATGGTLGQIVESLEGSVTARLEDGSFAGADLVATLETLAKGREFMTEKGGPLIPAAGRTQFDQVDAQVDFASGAASVSRAQIEGARIGITILGEVQLIEGRMSVGGRAVLLPLPEMNVGAALGAPLVNMPFGVGGTVLAPVVAVGVPIVTAVAAEDLANDP